MGHDDSIRKSWKTGSKLQIYSESKKQWYSGKIERIFRDAEGEWLAIKYAGFNMKEVQRYTEFIRPIPRRKGKQIPNGNGETNDRDDLDDDSKVIEQANDDRQSNAANTAQMDSSDLIFGGCMFAGTVNQVSSRYDCPSDQESCASISDQCTVSISALQCFLLNDSMW